jgi:hypothetical protein
VAVFIINNIIIYYFHFYFFNNYICFYLGTWTNRNDGWIVLLQWTNHLGNPVPNHKCWTLEQDHVEEKVRDLDDFIIIIWMGFKRFNIFLKVV